VALPNILVFRSFCRCCRRSSTSCSLSGLFSYLISRFFHPESTSPAYFQKLMFYFVSFMIIDFIASVIAFVLERRRPETREDHWLLSQVPIQRFAYRQLFPLSCFARSNAPSMDSPSTGTNWNRTAEVRYATSWLTQKLF